MKNIVVLIPGLLGSVLQAENGDCVWPGTAWENVSGTYPSRDFDRLLNDERLRAVALITSFKILGIEVENIYGPWIDEIERLGYRENRSLFPFPYDWRQDLSATARQLAVQLSHILTANPGAEISLVAHSGGGMIARRFIEGVEYQDAPERAAVRRLLMFGTATHGAPAVAAAALGLWKTDWLTIEQGRVLANDLRWPSLYQHTPAPDHSPIWLAGERLERYRYDTPERAQAVGLSWPLLEQAMQFRATLDPARRGDVRYVQFAGTGQETPTHIVWSGETGASSFRVHAAGVAGDGKVPVAALADAEVQTFHLTGEHLSLIDNDEARRFLRAVLPRLSLLQTSGGPDGDSQPVLVTTPRPAVALGEPIAVSIRWVRDARIEAELIVESAPVQANANTRELRRIVFDGRAGESLSLRLDGMTSVGSARVGLKMQDATIWSRRFVVQGA